MDIRLFMKILWQLLVLHSFFVFLDVTWFLVIFFSHLFFLFFFILLFFSLLLILLHTRVKKTNATTEKPQVINQPLNGHSNAVD